MDYDDMSEDALWDAAASTEGVERADALYQLGLKLFERRAFDEAATAEAELRYKGDVVAPLADLGVCDGVASGEALKHWSARKSEVVLHGTLAGFPEQVRVHVATLGAPTAREPLQWGLIIRTERPDELKGMGCEPLRTSRRSAGSNFPTS